MNVRRNVLIKLPFANDVFIVIPSRPPGAARIGPISMRPPPHWSHRRASPYVRSEEHTSELQSPCNLVCRLLLEKKKEYLRLASRGLPRRGAGPRRSGGPRRVPRRRRSHARCTCGGGYPALSVVSPLWRAPGGAA